MQDCAIGCFTGYDWNDVRVWARSLAASGFAGRKVALVRAPGRGSVDGLTGLGVEVLDFSQSQITGNPYVERFGHLRQFLFAQRRQGVEFRWVIATDVRDVCFQSNPIDYLSRFDPPQFVLSREGLPYEFAPWNARNLNSAFGPAALETLFYAAPNNVGVLAGGHWQLEGLALLIEALAHGAQTEIADQAAFNLLVEGMSGSIWAQRTGPADPWACHAGVVADPNRIERNRPHLIGPEPVLRDGLVRTASGEPYAIVHQYDLVPSWNAAITARFGG